MSVRVHVVREGEWLDTIAHEYGFASGLELYEDSLNAGLRELRKDPAVIQPGDEIWIPPCPYEAEVIPLASGGEEAELDVALPGVQKLVLVMRDAQGEPMANLDYNLRIGGWSTSGKTDGDGKLEQEFDTRLLRFDHYVLDIAGQTLRIRLGHLDPVESVKGVQARLNNLGYDCGPVDGIVGAQTRAAVRRFQADHDLQVDGIAGPKTQKKLDEVYG